MHALSCTRVRMSPSSLSVACAIRYMGLSEYEISSPCLSPAVKGLDFSFSDRSSNDRRLPPDTLSLSTANQPSSISGCWISLLIVSRIAHLRHLFQLRFEQPLAILLSCIRHETFSLSPEIENSSIHRSRVTPHLTSIAHCNEERLYPRSCVNTQQEEVHEKRRVKYLSVSPRTELPSESRRLTSIGIAMLRAVSRLGLP